ncbi:MAG: LLM class flavin-dependent oxidoreductase [Mycobacterium kyogaense]|uniref:LLM class flavin-dependent oxidoreductase n=1 Tax=Mycobacterium kyogaense TaxID=2212479 RepID=UPI002FFC01E7
MTQRYGVVWRPDGDPRTLAPFCEQAERAGFEEVWLWEDCFLQGGIAQAAVALMATRSLVVGIGVLPAPLRSVVATALEISTLATMFPGRVQVGIGHGVQDWMRQAGVAVASPLTYLREYVTALRDLLAGQTVDVTGDYVRLDAVHLDWVPDTAVPVLIGGTGPKTLALAGEIADGVLLDCQHTAASVTTALGHVSHGGTGRDAAGFRRVMYLACAPSLVDVGTRLVEEARRWHVTPETDFGVGGSAEAIRDGVAAYRAAGIDTVVFQPIGTDPDPMEFIGSLQRR